jgi:cytochrome P450
MNLLARIVRKVKSTARSILTPAAAPHPRTATPHHCTAATVDLGSPEIARDPFPHYEELRRAGSVQFLVKHDAWLVLGHDDVQFAFARPNLFSNQPYDEVDAVLLAADPPAHPPMRRIVMRYFSPGALDELCAFAEQHAASLLKPEIDVVRGYGLPLSEAVAAHLIGFDDRAVDDIRAAHAEAPELGPYTRALDRIAERATMYQSLRNDGLGDAEARSLIRLLWLAATTTTERVIARCVLGLLQHPDVARAVAHDHALIPAFVEEVLRLHPPEHMVPRLTTEPVTLGGVDIPARALVYLSVAAANRDPAKFEEPSAVRLDRPPVRHFTFGLGIHHCVGATLGRREIATSVRTLLTHAPGFRAVQPLETIGYWSTMTANAVERLVLDTGIAPGETHAP